MKRSDKYDFLEIHEIFNVTNSTNLVKEGIINFKYFNFDTESYSLSRLFEFVVGKKTRQQTCCSFVLPYSSPLRCYGPKSNLHHLRKISAEKHNGRVNSEIGYCKKSSSYLYVCCVSH